jgi:hypothetical protein
VFTKSYYYNLAADSPSKPEVENYLCEIEGTLSKFLTEIKSGPITNEILSFFSFYTTLQYIRVEKHIDMF